MKKPKKRSGLLRYWPHLTGKLAEIERQKMSDAQGAKCAICGKTEEQEGRRLAIDHNHKSGKVRALLCFYCNKYLVGRYTIEKAEKLLNYLLTYDLRQEKK